MWIGRQDSANSSDWGNGAHQHSRATSPNADHKHGAKSEVRSASETDTGITDLSVANKLDNLQILRASSDTFSTNVSQTNNSNLGHLCSFGETATTDGSASLLAGETGRSNALHCIEHSLVSQGTSDSSFSSDQAIMRKARQFVRRTSQAKLQTGISHGTTPSFHFQFPSPEGSPTTPRKSFSSAIPPTQSSDSFTNAVPNTGNQYDGVEIRPEETTVSKDQLESTVPKVVSDQQQQHAHKADKVLDESKTGIIIGQSNSDDKGSHPTTSEGCSVQQPTLAYDDLQINQPFSATFETAHDSIEKTAANPFVLSSLSTAAQQQILPMERIGKLPETSPSGPQSHIILRSSKEPADSSLTDTSNTSPQTSHLAPSTESREEKPLPFALNVFYSKERGLGFTLRNGSKYGCNHMIISVDKGGSGEEAGIRPGHAILQVDGIDVSEWSHQRLGRLIRSKLGHTIQLQLVSIPKKKKKSSRGSLRRMTKKMQSSFRRRNRSDKHKVEGYRTQSIKEKMAGRFELLMRRSKGQSRATPTPPTSPPHSKHGRTPPSSLRRTESASVTRNQDTSGSDSRPQSREECSRPSSRETNLNTFNISKADVLHETPSDWSSYKTSPSSWQQQQGTDATHPQIQNYPSYLSENSEQYEFETKEDCYSDDILGDSSPVHGSGREELSRRKSGIGSWRRRFSLRKGKDKSSRLSDQPTDTSLSSANVPVSMNSFHVQDLHISGQRLQRPHSAHGGYRRTPDFKADDLGPGEPFCANMQHSYTSGDELGLSYGPSISTIDGHKVRSQSLRTSARSPLSSVVTSPAASPRVNSPKHSISRNASPPYDNLISPSFNSEPSSFRSQTSKSSLGRGCNIPRRSSPRLSPSVMQAVHSYPENQCSYRSENIVDDGINTPPTSPDISRAISGRQPLGNVVPARPSPLAASDAVSPFFQTTSSEHTRQHQSPQSACRSSSPGPRPTRRVSKQGWDLTVTVLDSVFQMAADRRSSADNSKSPAHSLPSDNQHTSAHNLGVASENFTAEDDTNIAPDHDTARDRVWSPMPPPVKVVNQKENETARIPPVIKLENRSEQKCALDELTTCDSPDPYQNVPCFNQRHVSTKSQEIEPQSLLKLSRAQERSTRISHLDCGKQLHPVKTTLEQGSSDSNAPVHNAKLEGRTSSSKGLSELMGGTYV